MIEDVGAICFRSTRDFVWGNSFLDLGAAFIVGSFGHGSFRGISGFQIRGLRHLYNGSYH
jgi:hypothetical protein